jgi:hypothetical protein
LKRKRPIQIPEREIVSADHDRDHRQAGPYLGRLAGFVQDGAANDLGQGNISPADGVARDRDVVVGRVLAAHGMSPQDNGVWRLDNAFVELRRVCGKSTVVDRIIALKANFG